MLLKIIIKDVKFELSSFFLTFNHYLLIIDDKN
jgi:hypothetical protein